MFDLSVSKFESPPSCCKFPVGAEVAEPLTVLTPLLVTCRRLALLREGQWGRLQAVISKTANGRDFAGFNNMSKCGSFLYETV